MATASLLVGALAVPALLAGLALWRRAAPWARCVPIAASSVVLVAGLALVVVVRSAGPVVAAGGLLRADALAAYLLAVVGVVALTATWGGLEAHAPAAGTGTAPSDGRYAALVAVFLAAMSLALLADNLGLAWVAVEATTIATAFLVAEMLAERPR